MVSLKIAMFGNEKFIILVSYNQIPIVLSSCEQRECKEIHKMRNMKQTKLFQRIQR